MNVCRKRQVGNDVSTESSSQTVARILDHIRPRLSPGRLDPTTQRDKEHYPARPLRVHWQYLPVTHGRTLGRRYGKSGRDPLFRRV